eukprot:COSAG01_NODE_1202_length_11263_cov_64.078466_5_plen_95_part_00
MSLCVRDPYVEEQIRKKLASPPWCLHVRIQLRTRRNRLPTAKAQKMLEAMPLPPPNAMEPEPEPLPSLPEAVPFQGANSVVTAVVEGGAAAEGT